MNFLTRLLWALFDLGFAIVMLPISIPLLIHEHFHPELNDPERFLMHD
jgi:hypothetical protein